MKAAIRPVQGRCLKCRKISKYVKGLVRKNIISWRLCCEVKRKGAIITMKKYDYLVVGAGLYGAVFAHEATKAGKSVLVIDKRPNIAGNVYTEEIEGINVHVYGAHIFHTNNKRVWEYVNQFAEFNRFTNSPVANYKGELYSMPFNMYTFN